MRTYCVQSCVTSICAEIVMRRVFSFSEIEWKTQTERASQVAVFHAGKYRVWNEMSIVKCTRSARMESTLLPRPRSDASSRNIICRSRCVYLTCSSVERELTRCPCFVRTYLAICKHVRFSHLLCDFISTLRTAFASISLSFYLCAFLCFPAAVEHFQSFAYFISFSTLAHTCVTHAIAVFNRIWPPKWYSEFWIIVFFFALASVLLFRSSGWFFFHSRCVNFKSIWTHFGWFFFFISVESASNADAVLN